MDSGLIGVMNKIGIALLLWLGAIALMASAENALNVTEKEPPKDTPDAIKSVLVPAAVRLLQGDKPIYEFWWRRDIPLKEMPSDAAKSVTALDEMTLIGVAAVGEGRRDYKDNEIPPGTYTVRFGLQPQDGDHLGTAEFPYFAVLTPVKNDTAPGGVKTYKAMVKASGKATATGHPAVLSLRPPSSGAGEPPILTTPAPDHKAIRLKLPAQAGDQKTSLIFELVYEGKFKS